MPTILESLAPGVSVYMIRVLDDPKMAKWVHPVTAKSLNEAKRIATKLKGKGSTIALSQDGHVLSVKLEGKWSDVSNS